MMWTESLLDADCHQGRGAYLVRKYGGTSVATVARIKRIAEAALEAQRAGRRVLLVVSAMSGETNRLLALAHEVTPVPSLRETDVVAASGEQVSAALVAIAIEALGGKSRSFLAHQLMLRSDSHHAEARLLDLETARLVAAVHEGIIPVIAGFQGVTEAGDLTTLGRGGSDTTAVAVAAALGGAPCEIFTDVDGVYTADPGVCPGARRLDAVSYRHMLALSTLGAKVLHPRSVSLARKYRVPVVVRSSFAEGPGTWVRDELEASRVTSLACDAGLARVTVHGASAATLAERLAGAGIRFDAIARQEDRAVALVRHTDVARLRALLEPGSAGSVERLARVSLVGELLQTDPDAAARLFRALGRRRIHALGVQAGEMTLSVLVAGDEAHEASRALHEEFQLHEAELPEPKKETV